MGVQKVDKPAPPAPAIVDITGVDLANPPVPDSITSRKALVHVEEHVLKKKVRIL